MTWLPDGNILVALVLTDHADHVRALSWFQGNTMDKGLAADQPDVAVLIP